MIRRTVGNLRTAPVVLLAIFGLTACPGPDDAELTIVEPMDGAELTLADDTNGSVDGVQISVRVQAVGVAVGDEIDVLVDGVTRAGSGIVPEDGNVIVENVTIPNGAHTLEAVTSSGSATSPAVTVTVTDSCFSVTFVTPVPSGPVTFGPDDDTDGIECGDTFETTVIVSTSAPDGSSARVFVNGTPRITGTVAGGVARFEGVAFDNRGARSNELRVEVTDGSGVACSSVFRDAIFVDCEGVSCAIISPDTGTGFLSANEDVSDAAGFQGDFEVQTDAEGSGQPIRLIIDGNETDALTADPDGVVATFGNVSLSEGVHRVQAVCLDTAGNEARSGVAEWTVDTNPCAVEILSPDDGTLFIDSDDLDPGMTGIQIEATGSAGSDCRDLRVGACSGIDGLAFDPAASSWTSTVTLGSTPMQQICAQSRDEAGNLNTSMIDVRVQTAAPQLEIATPATGASFNILGGGGRTADLDPSSGTCEATFEVYCTGVGSAVDLVREDTAATIDTAQCDPDATAPAPFSGRATFSLVPLPSVESGTTYNVFARQTVDRLTGMSLPVAITADCIAPALSVVRPTCGATLRPADDEIAGTMQLEYRTNISFPNGQSGDQVTLTIRPTGGGAPTHMETRSYTASPVQFFSANYGSGGSLDIVATAVDAAGNAGMSPMCSVMVEDLPTLTITAPADGAVLGPAADCSGAAGFQARVQGTTDAADGSTVTVSVGGGPAVMSTVSGGAIDVCTDAPDGRSVVIRVTVMDARGSANAMVTVTIDTMPPTGAISDLMASVLDDREGSVRFTWTAVADAGGFTLSRYELRCAAAPITTETEWTMAAVVPMLTTPGSPGTMQSEDLRGFRPGQTRYCVLRGGDPGGGLTPLPATSTSVAPVFRSQLVTFGGSSRFANAIAPVGDLNGDLVDDVVLGGGTDAWIYFGAPGALGSSATVRIIGSAGWTLRPAGLGDFNGDGMPDFAVSASVWGAELGAGQANRGAVFVFFGRDSTRPWPSSITIAANGTTCVGPDVCFYGNDMAAGAGFDELAGLGFSIAAAGDFDGDGLMDLLAGAPGAGGAAMGLPGRAYILLGSTSYTAGTAVNVPGTGAGPDGFFIQGDGTVRRSLGNVVAGLGGDLDGDMRHDVLVQAPGNAAMMINARVDRFAGRMYTDGSGLTQIPLTAADPVGSGGPTNYGALIAAAGDVDEDGVLDVLVYNRQGGGGIEIHYGVRSGFSGGPFSQIMNDSALTPNDQFGSTLGIGRHGYLGNLGDIDGDGSSDVVVGSVEEGTGPGSVDFFYRTNMRTDVARSRRDVVFGPAASSIAATDGVRAAYIGDVNGDGFPDIAVGDPAASAAGQMTIYY